jgi:hypothetical protein
VTTPQENPSPEELKAAEAKLQSLQQHNEAELMAIAKMGAEMDGSALVAIRVNTFISFVFDRLGTSSPEVRQILTSMFEIEYQEQISETLNGLKSEIRKAMLAAGGSASPQQMRQMWQRGQNGHGETPPPGFTR